ncbi:MAG: WecB/TagA/CpsF family glycosyltransferase [Acidobacteriota bacterium]|nr:WecB/TagA/CpsF family glycosyltransferase [Acidobacteriota bacterium]
MVEERNLTQKSVLPRVSVIGLRANVCGGLETVVERIAEMAQGGAGDYVCFSTVHMAMESYDDPEFSKIVNGADFIVTDGMPLVWMQKLQGAQKAARVRANDLMISLCEYAERNNLKVGFYGGKPEVIEGIRERAAKDFPNLQIVYAFSPPFRTLSEEEDRQITDEINRAGTQILFVGLGCPKQERWMATHKGKIKAVMLGVGASFDFYAGNVSESPAWLGNLGLEWLYRLTQEPRRLWRRYLILNPRFMTLAALQLGGLKKFGEETRQK